ncbi:MAG: hypothetical protein AAGA53_17810 [Pseudomonadota bacterium]
MHKAIYAFAISATLALPVVETITPAGAAVPGRGPVVRINGEGKRICDAFADRGTPYWSAKVRGRLEDDSGGFTDRFQIRTCFESRAKCDHFLNRIHHTILSIEEIYFIRCKAEG